MSEIMSLKSYKRFLYSQYLSLVREVLEELYHKNPNGYIKFKSFTVRKRLEAKGIEIGNRMLHKILVQLCDVVDVRKKNRGTRYYYVYRYPKLSQEPWAKREGW